MESSCDETACGIVRNGSDLLFSAVHSQTDIHAKYGGVIPEIAARQHLEAIDQQFYHALRGANLSFRDVDAIAVTQGPGLMGALLVGISFAKGLAASRNLPLVPVNHLEAHIHAALFGQVDLGSKFPALALVVSGGHTTLFYMENIASFKTIGVTHDDACGECFDKVAKLLGFGYPGGAAIEAQALQGDASRFPMPRVMESKSKIEFSYSGLKTHMAILVRQLGDKIAEPQTIADLCAAFQEAALDQIIRKLQGAFALYPESKSLLIGGGVSINRRLRELSVNKLRVPVYFPEPSMCSDNGAMIAATGFYNYQVASDRDVVMHWSKNWDAYDRVSNKK